MGKYIHLFDAASEFNEAYNGSSYEEPWVSYTEEDDKVSYNKVPYGLELKKKFGLDDNAWGIAISPPMAYYDPKPGDGWRHATQEEEAMGIYYVFEADSVNWKCCSFEDLTYDTLVDYVDTSFNWDWNTKPYGPYEYYTFPVLFKQPLGTDPSEDRGPSFEIWKDEDDELIINLGDHPFLQAFKHDGTIYYFYQYYGD